MQMHIHISQIEKTFREKWNWGYHRGINPQSAQRHASARYRVPSRNDGHPASAAAIERICRPCFSLGHGLGQARLFGKFFEKLPVLKEREKSRESCQSPPAGGEPSAGGATVLFRESVTSLNKSSIVAKEKPFRRNRAFFCPRAMTGELSPASATEPLNKSCDILINQVFGKAAALAREHIFEKFSKSCQSFQEKFERKVASDMKKSLACPNGRAPCTLL